VRLSLKLPPNGADSTGRSNTVPARSGRSSDVQMPRDSITKAEVGKDIRTTSAQDMPLYPFEHSELKLICDQHQESRGKLDMFRNIHFGQVWRIPMCNGMSPADQFFV